LGLLKVSVRHDYSCLELLANSGFIDFDDGFTHFEVVTEQCFILNDNAAGISADLQSEPRIR
jgi:hypothetical protein